MWFVTFLDRFSLSSPIFCVFCIIAQLRAPGTGYGTRTYRVRRYIYTVYMRKIARYTRVLQFLHVFHERGHHTLDTFVFIGISVIVGIVKEFPHRILDIRLIYLTWIIHHIISPPHIIFICYLVLNLFPFVPRDKTYDY